MDSLHHIGTVNGELNAAAKQVRADVEALWRLWIERYGDTALMNTAESDLRISMAAIGEILERNQEFI